MEYFTTAEQELPFRTRYQERMAVEQDRPRILSSSRGRISPHQEDRRFFVEPEGVYFGEIKPGTECPPVRTDGGTYEVDPIFLREVQDFVQRHSRYMIVFHIREGYSRRAGVYPARMIAEGEELFLEEVYYM